MEAAGTKHTLHVAGVAAAELMPDWRTRFLAVITNPSVAYLLILLGAYALLFEFMNPGLILPGVWSGWLSDRLGYKYFFTWVMASTLFSFVATALVPFKSAEDIAAEEAAEEAA